MKNSKIAKYLALLSLAILALPRIASAADSCSYNLTYTYGGLARSVSENISNDIGQSLGSCEDMAIVRSTNDYDVGGGSGLAIAVYGSSSARNVGRALVVNFSGTLNFNGVVYNLSGHSTVESELDTDSGLYEWAIAWAGNTPEYYASLYLKPATSLPVCGEKYASTDANESVYYPASAASDIKYLYSYEIAHGNCRTNAGLPLCVVKYAPTVALWKLWYGNASAMSRAAELFYTDTANGTCQ